MNSLTKLALKRPVSAILIVLALIVFGISSVFGFKMELTPDIEMPMLFVLTVYQGGDPETTEKLVTRVIEDAGKTLSGVDSIDSQTTANSSFVMFTYEYGTDIDEAYSDLRSTMDSIITTLPEDAQEPRIIEMNMNAQDIMTISVTTTGDTDVLSFVNDEIVPELERLTDVADVSVAGGEEDYIKIELRQDQMQLYGVTMANIATYISTMDFTIPVGSMEQGTQSISTSASSKPETLIDLQNIPIITSRGTTVKLSDVATVTMSSKENNSISRFNGKESISIGIGKAQSASTVGVSGQVKELLEKTGAKNSAIQISVVYDAAEGITSSLSAVAETLVLGVLFSMLVLFIFFGDVKASLIVGSSMPISLLATLIFMSVAGFSLNIVTMTSLVIAIGMMVDSSIVVLESCFRLKDEKADFKDAALAGTSVVASSVIASTITTVVVYFPLATLKGLSGQLFSQLGFTIIFAMLSSLIVALTLIPIFFWKYRPKEKKNILANRILDKVGNGYRWLLRHIMLKKKTVMLVSILLLIGSFALASQLETELLPATGLDSVSIEIEQRSGTRLSIIDENIQFIEQMIIDDPNFAGCNVTISGSKANITGIPSEECEKSVQELVDEYNVKLSGYPNMSIIVSAAGSGMASQLSVGSSTEIDLSGENVEDLKIAARQVESLMMDIPGVLKTSSNVASDSSQAKLQIDSLKCMDAGLTAVQVASEMYNACNGKEAMTMKMNSEEYSVVIEYPEGTFNDMNKLLNMQIMTPRGSTIIVDDVADVVYSDVPETLVRSNGLYQVSIMAYSTEDTKFSAQSAIYQAVTEAEKNGELPKGVGQTQSMMVEMMNDEFQSIGTAILTAVFLIFLVMAMQFESPRFSLMVMLSIPFSLIGSFFLLFVSGSTLSMTSLMGILMLVGIVVNNGILYVDTANMLQEKMSLNEALMESGKIRLRPILMTTLTTILSMLPMLFSTNENAEMMKGMALIIIGGLITSTLLILLLLPSFYLIMSKKGRQEAKERRKQKKQMKQEDKLAKAEEKQ